MDTSLDCKIEFCVLPFLNLTKVFISRHSRRLKFSFSIIAESRESYLPASFPPRSFLDQLRRSRDLTFDKREHCRYKETIDGKREGKEQEGEERTTYRGYTGVYVSGNASCMPIVGRISRGT